MKFLCVLCILCVFSVPALAIDREAFTFTDYNLDVRIEPGQQRLAVRGRIAVRNDSAVPQKTVVLQISSTLGWRSIKIGGKPAEFTSHTYTSDIDHTGALSEALVALSQEVPAQGTVELEVGYEGIVPLDATRLTRIGVPEDKAKHSDWDQISKSFSAVRGIGYVAWYPVATEAANLSEANGVFQTVRRWKERERQANFNLALHYSGDSAEIPPRIACNGSGNSGYKEMGRAQIADRDCSLKPAGTTVPAFALARYSVLDRDTTTIYHLPEHKTGAENYSLAAALVLPQVKDWFGEPKQKTDVVELADPQAAPFESGAMLLTPLTGNDSRLYQLTAAHQLTHAAFFSARPWIYEGLAHFAQALEREQQRGRQAALDFMGLHRTAVADAEKAIAMEHRQDAAAQESLINTATEEFYRSKALYVWWMLRDMVGEATLKKALTAYHADQDHEAAYMQHLLEAQSRRDLGWFFDDWVYHDRGLPDFRVESAYSHPTVNGGYVVTVTVENLGDAGAEVPVIVKMERGDVAKRIEVRAKSKASIRIESPTLPQEVVVSDGSVPESNLSNNAYRIESPTH